MKHTFPKILLFSLLLNAAITPALYAATSNEITRSTTYAFGLLGLVILGLAIYLVMVIMQPEKF